MTEEEIRLDERKSIIDRIRQWTQNDFDYDDFMYFLNELEKGEEW